MSFLGLGGNKGGASAGAGGINRTKIDMAEAEVDAVADLFSRLVDACYAKCLQGGSYNDSNLSKQESLCLDRCVAKYFDVNAKVGESMQTMGQKAFGR